MKTTILPLTAALLLASCAHESRNEPDALPGWQGCELQGDPLILGLAFAGDDRGFAVGGTTERGPSVILRTDDEGASWNAVPVEAGGRLYDVVFPTWRRGYAVGYGVIVRTKDRGRSWEAVTIPADRWLAAVDFVSQDVGFAAGGHGDEAVLWTTVDGGDSWIAVDDRLPESNRSALRDVRFFDERHGVVLGTGGSLCETLDGGATWARVETGSEAWLRSIHRQGTRDWIAASPGLITRASPEARWSEIPAFAEEKLSDVYFHDDQRGWVTRAAGSIHATLDGGATWFPSLNLRGTPTCLVQHGDEWLFAASDAGLFRMSLR